MSQSPGTFCRAVVAIKIRDCQWAGRAGEEKKDVFLSACGHLTEGG